MSQTNWAPAAADGVEDRAIGKAVRRLLPFLILMYLLAYLDRANIGYAKQAFQAATGVTEAAFALGAGIFFLTYAVFEVPSNLLLHRLGARVWMSRIMVSWGIISAAMMFAFSDTTFYVLRLLLGAAEAGFFPGIILFLTYWFPSRSRARIMGLFYYGAPLALMLGGPFSGLLLTLDGLLGLQGWQWMFLIEGLMAAIVGVIAFFYLTDRPADAMWLAPEERNALSSAVTFEEQQKQASGTVSFGSVIRDSRLLHFALIYFLIQVSAYGVAFYLPTLVSELLGVRIGLLVGFVSAIPWACAIVAATIWPPLAAKTGRRRTFAFISLLCAAIALVVAGNSGPLIGVMAFCLVTMGFISAQPIFWTFPTNYLGGAAAAGGIAAINAIGNLGGFAAPTLKTWAEQSFHSSAAGLYVLSGAALAAALLVAVIPRSQVGMLAKQGIASETA